MLSDLFEQSPIAHNIAFSPLANKLKLALESCEPDIFKLLSAIQQCLKYLDVLLGDNNVMLQKQDYDTLIYELNAIIKSGGAKCLKTADKDAVELKDAMTQTDHKDFRKECGLLYSMMNQQRSEILGMIQDLSLMARKYIPARKSLEQLKDEFENIRESQIKLNYYLEYLKYEVIKHRVRPGKERILILTQEHKSLSSGLARFKEDMVKDNYAYRQDDQFKELWKMIQEQDILDLKMKSLLEILNQVVSLQDNKDSIEAWINRTKDSAHYMKELEIRLKCYTSQERLDSLYEIESIRNYEKGLFNQNQLQRELNEAIQCKSDIMASIQQLDKVLEDKYQDYIFILWKQR